MDTKVSHMDKYKNTPSMDTSRKNLKELRTSGRFQRLDGG